MKYKQLNLFEKITNYKDNRKNKIEKIWSKSYWNKGLYYWTYKNGMTVPNKRTFTMKTTQKIENQPIQATNDKIK